MTRLGSLRITTKHELVDEFLTSFSKWVDDESIFIVTKEVRPVGVQLNFMVELKDGRPILRGDAEIVETYTDNNGPNGKNGIRLRILDMDVRSREVFRQLLNRRRMAAPMHNPQEDSSLPPLPVLVEDGFDTVLDELPATATPLSIHPTDPPPVQPPSPFLPPRHESAPPRPLGVPPPVVAEPRRSKATIFLIVLFLIAGILFIVNMVLIITK